MYINIIFINQILRHVSGNTQQGVLTYGAKGDGHRHTEQTVQPIRNQYFLVVICCIPFTSEVGTGNENQDQPADAHVSTDGRVPKCDKQFLTIASTRSMLGAAILDSEVGVGEVVPTFRVGNTT